MMPKDASKEIKSDHSFKSVGDGQQVHEKIAAQIKDAIFDKKFKPGERLPSERELADIFRTSRVTVRSAILTLKNGGLLYVKKGTGGGTFVADDIGETEISELLENIIKWKNISIHNVIEVRNIIEPQIAYMAAKNATDQDIKRIWVTIEELEYFFKIKNKFQSGDENFHKALSAAAKNPLLSVFQASLIYILFKFIYHINWQEEHKKSILMQHRNIAEQVAQKKPESAREAMLEHLRDMQHILSRVPVTKVLAWM
jgi:GntR family transcriptional repressor for pyruvate dehydrogenase complex